MATKILRTVFDPLCSEEFTSVVLTGVFGLPSTQFALLEKCISVRCDSRLQREKDALPKA